MNPKINPNLHRRCCATDFVGLRCSRKPSSFNENGFSACLYHSTEGKAIRAARAAAAEAKNKEIAP